MGDYLLFIDIEASGLPKRWDLPYSVGDNWPHTIQVSWVVFDKDGRQVKTEDLYIKDSAIAICEKARRIHRLTQEFLHLNGRKREDVLAILQADLETYRPLIVGHFVELDFRVLSADYHRIGKQNPMQNYPMFCTMLGTKHLVRNPAKEYLRLEELHALLFGDSFFNQHNALDDAYATAKCFFELMKRKQISPVVDLRDVILLSKRPSGKVGCTVFVFLLFITLATLCICL